MRQHCETLNNILLAEFDHFSTTLESDTRTMIGNFLKQQAEFHRNVSEVLFFSVFTSRFPPVTR